MSANFPSSSIYQKTLLASLIGLLLTLSACSKAPDDHYSSRQSDTQSATATVVASSPAMATLSEQAKAHSASSTASSPDGLTLGNNIVNQQQTNTAFANKKMLVTAKADFQVKDVQQTANQIETLTQQNGGYVAHSEIGNDDKGSHSYPIGNYQLKQLTTYSRHATLVVRVPKNQVGNFLRQLQSYIAFLDKSEFDAKDVTLEIQKAQVEAQIQALKAEQIAKATADKTTQTGNIDIANQTALSRQEQLYADLQRQSLEDEVNLSSVQLNFYQPEKIRETIVEDIDGKMQSEKSVNFLPRLSDNLKTGWLYLVEFLLVISQLWSLALGALLLWWAWRWFNKFLVKQAKKHPKATHTAPMQTVDSSNQPPKQDDTSVQPFDNSSSDNLKNLD